MGPDWPRAPLGSQSVRATCRTMDWLPARYSHRRWLKRPPPRSRLLDHRRRIVFTADHPAGCGCQLCCVSRCMEQKAGRSLGNELPFSTKASYSEQTVRLSRSPLQLTRMARFQPHPSGRFPLLLLRTLRRHPEASRNRYSSPGGHHRLHRRDEQKSASRHAYPPGFSVRTATACPHHPASTLFR